jgi:hypothetical protein
MGLHKGPEKARFEQLSFDQTPYCPKEYLNSNVTRNVPDLKNTEYSSEETRGCITVLKGIYFL